MNNFYDKTKTFIDIKIIEDYNPENKNINIEDKNKALALDWKEKALIIPSSDTEKYVKILGKVAYYGARYVIEIYLKTSSSGLVYYGVSFLVDYLNDLNK